jgi:hypothetical protein
VRQRTLREEDARYPNDDAWVVDSVTERVRKFRGIDCQWIWNSARQVGVNAHILFDLANTLERVVDLLRQSGAVVDFRCELLKVLADRGKLVADVFNFLANNSGYHLMNDVFNDAGDGAVGGPVADVISECGKTLFDNAGQCVHFCVNRFWFCLTSSVYCAADKNQMMTATQ